MSTDCKYGVRVVGHRGTVLAEWLGTNRKALMAEADQRFPDAWCVTIRTDYTSEGTYHGPGGGRMVATREGWRGWFVDVGDSTTDARAY